MLEKSKRKIKKLKKSGLTFEEIFVNYLLFIQDINILSEMEYIKEHNTLDILNIDRWIDNLIKEELLK